MVRSNTADKIFEITLYIFAFLLILIVVGFFFELLINSLPSIKSFGFSFLFNSKWNPVKEIFGALPFIVGTLITSILAVLVSSPISIGTAIFIDEYVNKRFSNLFSSLIEILAAIPSVIYGLWGIFFIVPIVRKIEFFFYNNFSYIKIFRSQPSGVGIMSAVVILCIMIIPYTVSVCKELLKLVPGDQLEAGYSLGITKWEVISKIKLPYIRSGLFAGIGLSLGRALGETMAVTMLIGNRNALPLSIFDPSNTLASVIANEFNEATGTMHLSSLIELGLILFLITFIINILMRITLKRLVNK